MSCNMIFKESFNVGVLTPASNTTRDLNSLGTLLAGLLDDFSFRVLLQMS